MTIQYIIYHILIVLSVILSFVAIYNGHKRYLPLLLVLIFTELVEITAQFSVLKNLSFVWLYHVFVFIEYSFLALYLRLSIQVHKVKILISLSIPVFIVFSLLISRYFYHFMDFPGINISTEGLLLFVFCTVLLFNLEVVENESVFFNPDVWIVVGILIFYGGTFFYNGVFTKLLEMDPDKALKLFGVINKPLNLCLYTFINIGLVCLLKRKRYIMQ